MPKQEREAPRLEATGAVANFKCKDEKLSITLELAMTPDRVEETARLMTRGTVAITLVPVQIDMGDMPTRSDRQQGELPLDGAPELCICGHLVSRHTVAEGVVECWADACIGEGRCPCKAIEPLDGAEDNCGEGIDGEGCGHYRRLHDPSQRLIAHVPLPERPDELPLCYAHGIENPCACPAFVEPAIPGVAPHDAVDAGIDETAPPAS